MVFLFECRSTYIFVSDNVVPPTLDKDDDDDESEGRVPNKNMRQCGKWEGGETFQFPLPFFAIVFTGGTVTK